MDYNLCLHADSKDPAILRLVLKNATNYLKGLPNEKFQIAIVANGPAVTLFTKNNSELYEMAKPLIEKGVIFKICANALNDNQIKHDDLWIGCEVVDAGLVEIVHLQRKGYAYIKP